MKEEKPLKFFMVTTFYPPYNFGGDGIYIYRLVNELARRGHLVDVVHCEDSYALLRGSGVQGDYPNHANVRVQRLKSGAGFLSPLLTQQTGVPFFKGKIIKRMLEQNDYDVIHYHNMSLIGIAALQYGHGHAIKLYTTHEHWLVCPMHVLWKYNREICTKRSCTLCQLAGKRPPQLWRHTGLMERMLRQVDCFIAPSRFTRDKHIELGLEIPIIHLPYFLPQSEEQRPGRSPGESTFGSRPYFLFVGRLEKIKGVQNLIPVFRSRSGYDLLVAGVGEYEAELRRQAKDASNIKFLGRLEQLELRELYRNAVALIVPSICYETFGIVIIEAFSVKAPVIAHDLGALPEVIEESGGGFTYNDQNQLLSAMDRLASEPDLRNELGLKGYNAYLRYWTEDAHMEQYLGLIQGVREQRENAAISPLR